jgi:uncharacterized protein YbjT (DUF2867 family)
MKVALIAGYSGLVGTELLHLLLESDKYDKVIAIGRRATDFDHPKLEQRIVDFNSLGFNDSINDIFCCLGTTIKKAGSKEKFRLVDYQYPLNLALAGQQAGATCFNLVSAHGASSSSNIFYSQVKGDLEDSISSLNYPKLEIVRPSLLLGERSEKRAGEDLGKIIMSALGFLFIGPLKNIKGIQASSVAKAMLFFANDGSGGKRVHYSSVLQRFN